VTGRWKRIDFHPLNQTVFNGEKMPSSATTVPAKIVDKIPRNTLGKIDRQLLSTMISEYKS
jgi:hypothetical protein